MAANEKAYVEFGQSFKHNTGTYPSICVNDSGTVVKVMNSGRLENKMLYWVGKIEDSNEITWGEGIVYDYGSYPRVAINNSGAVVEVHESTMYRDLYYRVGVVDETSQKIEWGDATCYERGLIPAVAVRDDGTVITVHLTSALGSYTSYYRVGTVDVTHKTITWGPSHSYGVGKGLAVAVNNDGAVVEVHKNSQLEYRLGQLNQENQTISWGPNTVYAEGANPCIAIDSRGHVLEAHQEGTFSDLYCRIGNINMAQQKIDWVRKESSRYEIGCYPSICLNDNMEKNVVEAHEPNFGKNGWYCTGTLK